MLPWLTMPVDPKKAAASPVQTFHRCEKCGLGAAAPLPDPSEVPEFYKLDAYYTQGQSHFPLVSSGLKDKLLLKIAYWGDNGEEIDAPYFRPPGADPRFLDVGSGGGDLLEAFADAGYAAYGVEPDPTAKSFSLPGGSGARGEIRVFGGRAEAMPDEITSLDFDVIAMTHVLEHCVRPDVAIGNIRALLKPEGRLWLEVPNAACAHFEQFNVCSEMFDAPRHLYFFDDRNLRRLLQNHGLLVERVYFRGFLRHHNADWRAWECAIYDMVRAEDPCASVKRHGFLQSSALLARTLFAPARRKYDCVGMICRLS